MNLTMEDLLGMPHLEARNAAAGRRRRFTGVSTDSRTVRRGELFVALRGDSFDGNAFVARAFRRGAAAAVVDTPAGARAAGRRPVVRVRDSADALGAIARLYRSRFDIPVIGVAGSNGKTTTKEMIAAVLGKKIRVLATEGNLNNHIGVPMTLLRLRPAHGAAVVEMGTNHFGEVRRLARIALPTHGLITNVGREHLQHFRTIAGAARAEGELFEHLAASGGAALVNADDPRVVRLARRVGRRMTYGFGKGAGSVRGTGLSIDRSGNASFTVERRGARPFAVKLAAPGRHAASNALAAAAAGVAFGVPASSIGRALAAFRPVGKRMEVLRAGGVTILNDTYNANPESMLSALETLALFRGPGRRIVVLADMLEMGKAAAGVHAAVGRAVAKAGFRHLFAYGPMAKKYLAGARRGGRSGRAAAEVTGRHYTDKKSLAADLRAFVRPGDVVLVKGSRGMRMEEVVQALAGRSRRAA